MRKCTMQDRFIEPKRDDAGTKWMTFKYVFALSLIALLSFTAYHTLENVIETEATSAAIINVSGRQRMLSQRNAIVAEKYTDGHYDNTPDENLKPLRDAIDLMEKTHNGLINGDPGMGLPGNPSQTVGSMYFDRPLLLDQQVRKYISEGPLPMFRMATSQWMTPISSILIPSPATNW